MSVKTNRKRENLFFLIFLTYLSVLIYLLFTGSTGINYNQFPHEDKLLHFAAFFCGQFFVMFSAIGRGIIKKVIYVFFISLPLVSEYVQYHIPTRVTDKWDMIAGYLGIIACIVLFMGIKLIRFIYIKTKESKRIKIKGEY